MAELNPISDRDCYPDMPEALSDAALTTLGTIRKRLADAFERLESLKANATDGCVAPLESLEALQAALADIQVTQLPALESLFCLLFVKIDPEQGVVYEPLTDEDTEN